ncbi:MAG: DinB family protein [Acidimicrobiia bacterium]
MTDVLLDAFRHNNWATRQLLEVCVGLDPEQLGSTSSGSYGDILATFSHIVNSDGSYLWRLTESSPEWFRAREQADFEQLLARVDELGPLWEQYVSSQPDGERVHVIDDGAYEVRAGVIVAQALHHGNAHREQICAILTGLEIEPPDVQPWGYAWAAKRIWERTAES